MSRRGLRSWLGFTGTGLAHAITGMPGERAHRRQDDRPERVDVRDRVQGEPARPLRGVVTEPEGDDAVADLVEDDRDDQAAEPDDGLFEIQTSGYRRADAQVMQNRADGIASSRASPICSPQDSHFP